MFIEISRYKKHVRYAEYKLVIISIALQLHPLEPFYELLPLELLRINYKSWKRYKLAHWFVCFQQQGCLKIQKKVAEVSCPALKRFFFSFSSNPSVNKAHLLLESSFYQPKYPFLVSFVLPLPPLWEKWKRHTERSSKISTISFTLPTGFLKRRSSIEINFLRLGLALTGFENATVLWVLRFCTGGALLLSTASLPGTAAMMSVFL